MPQQTTTTTLLQTFALTSTLSLATAMGTTSLLFIPSLLRPLTTTSTSSAPSSAPISRQSSALDIPTLNAPSSADGRLTPQPRTPSGNHNAYFPSGGSPSLWTYRTVAQQFSLFDTVAFRLQVPLELLAVGAYTAIAVRAYRADIPAWRLWAAAGGLLASVFPYTGILMAPLSLKIRRLGGDEEKVEPYEDAPIDREAERENTMDFLSQWTWWNGARAGVVLAAGAVGCRALVEG